MPLGDPENRIFPYCSPWIGTARYIYSDDERKAVNDYPCPACGAGSGEGCKTGTAPGAPAVHAERLSLVRPS